MGQTGLAAVLLAASMTHCTGSSDVRFPSFRDAAQDVQANPLGSGGSTLTDGSIAIPHDTRDGNAPPPNEIVDGHASGSLDAIQESAPHDETGNSDTEGDASAASDAGAWPDVPEASADADNTDAGVAPCLRNATLQAVPHAAKSVGYSGTADAYDALWDVPCPGQLEAEPCRQACIDAGGSTDSCTSSSRCERTGSGSGHYCAPPSYWRDTSSALGEPDSPNGSAQLTVIDTPYADGLVLTDFRAQLPSDAVIRGIEFELERGVDEADAVADRSIKLVVGGLPVGEDHANDEAWTRGIGSVTYGGPLALWGIGLTPSQLAEPGVGIMIALKFLGAEDSAEAHVDSIRMTVYYDTAGCR